MVISPPARFADSEEWLHEEAARMAGSNDFGDDAYLEGLRVLLAGYDEEARFNAQGSAMARQMLLGILVSRLRSEKQFREAPEILEASIERPIVICGLIRTGSTALHYLLGQDPDLQALTYWLGASPQPRPPRSEWEAHPDFQLADAQIKAMYDADPSLKAVHFMRPDLPEECRQLMIQQFTDDGFEVNNHLPSYSSWYQQIDMRPTYRRHLDLLKLIGSAQPKQPWLLKYPVHMRYLDAFLDVYPDACVVQTHRDPLSVFPSYLSLITGFRALVERDIDPGEIARRQVDLWARGAEHAIEVRRQRDPRQFYDLHFADFMADPIQAVRNIYSHFGRELSEAGERKLRTWQAENPQHKHGRHEYSRASDDMGIQQGEILERFGPYMDHFGLQPEDRP
jgi:hypothetical protein